MSETSFSVVISEPHIFSSNALYGGHQYAKIFARHGWKVILVSASFCYWRRFYPTPNNTNDYNNAWEKNGTTILPNLTAYTFAHYLPSRLRHRKSFSWVSHKLFSPNPNLLLKDLGTKKITLLWLNGNEDWLFRKAIPHQKLIVRIIDNYAGFEAGYDNFHPYMKETILVADGVFTCSDYVREMYEGITDKIVTIPNGVDYEKFSNVNEEEPPILNPISKPRVVYVGAISSWFDWELMVELAQQMININFILIGPWLREIPKINSYPRNIIILGEIEYDAIPSILNHCDVGLVPFKNCDLVQGISPIKIYEYLASGLPVVSLRWRELQKQNLPIKFAEGVGEFNQEIVNALKMDVGDRRKLQIYARSQSWEARLKRILNEIGLPLNAG